MQRQCTCVKCGKEFIARRKGAMYCSEACRKIGRLESSKAWYRKNKEHFMERQRERRAEEKRVKVERVRKEDSIVAIGYAERQMADTLKMAGSVKKEL